MIQTLHIVPEYNEELIYPAICKSMEALNIAADLRPEMKIVIKPNLVMAKSPDFPATTHPLVIKAVIRWLRADFVEQLRSYQADLQVVVAFRMLPEVVFLIRIKVAEWSVFE